METCHVVNPTVSAADKANRVPRVGVGVVVLNSKNQVLVGKRKSPHGRGKPKLDCINYRHMVTTRRILLYDLN
jgi:hypothetical protein